MNYEQPPDKPLFKWFRRSFIFIVCLAVALYFAFCPKMLMNSFSGNLLFPMAADQSIYAIPIVNGIKKEDIYFKNANSNTLHGWLFNNIRSKKTVLFMHGNAGNISHRLYLIQPLLDAGASVFIFDYRGYGQSTGEPTIPGAIADAEAAYDYLQKNRKIPEHDIVLYGESIGGGMAGHLLAEKPVGGIILDSTFTTLMHVGKKHFSIFKIYPDWLDPDPPLDITASLQGKHPPLLLIHGMKDELIPYSEAEQNFAQASEPKKLVSLPNSTHNCKNPDFMLYATGLKEYFKQLN